MGMFDTIRCEWPLPDAADGSDMQTKSLGCLLNHYVLGADGVLRHADGAPSGFHGVLRMVGSRPGLPLDEYEAKFNDGHLVYLVTSDQARFDADSMGLKSASASAPARWCTKFRSARPSDRLPELRRFYVDALGCMLLAEWSDHEGFDGLVVGDVSGAWQVEFLREHARAAVQVPSNEHLLVFYLADRAALTQRAAALDAAGHTRAEPNNPYWSRHGVTFVDPDGYHVVLAVPHGI